MAGKFIKTSLRMAAPAAILILLPSVAMAEVCDKGGFIQDTLSSVFPGLTQWVESSPQRAQLEKLFQPETWVIGTLLIWLLASNRALPAVIAACFFAVTTIVAGASYLMIDMGAPYYKAALAEGCLDPTPRPVYMGLLFTVMAVWLTMQRLKRRKAG